MPADRWPTLVTALAGWRHPGSCRISASYRSATEKCQNSVPLFVKPAFSMALSSSAR